MRRICRLAVGQYDAECRQDRVTEDLLGFFADRLEVHLRTRGVRYDLIGAVFALGEEDDLVRLLARVEALDAFLAGEDGVELMTGFKRAANILKIEEKKDGIAHDAPVEADKLILNEEKALYEALISVRDTAGRLLHDEDFVGAMTAFATLRGPVDAFFDRVTVNADVPAHRANRLRLLSQIRATMTLVADFSRVAG